MLPVLKFLGFLCFASASAAASTSAMEELWSQVMGEPLQDSSARNQKQGCAVGNASSLNQQAAMPYNKENASLKAASPLESRYPSLLVFVSTSMGETALETLAQELHALKKRYSSLTMAFVLRGLIDKSLKKTVGFIHAQGVDVLIDPTLFRKFNATHVPVLILHDYSGLEPIESQTFKYDKATGNIKIQSFLELAMTRGETATGRSLKAKGDKQP